MTEPDRPDAPNQQVVRPDGSHPADEGTGAGKAPRKASAGSSARKSRSESDPPSDEANG